MKKLTILSITTSALILSGAYFNASFAQENEQAGQSKEHMEHTKQIKKHKAKHKEMRKEHHNEVKEMKQKHKKARKDMKEEHKAQEQNNNEGMDNTNQEAAPTPAE